MKKAVLCTLAILFCVAAIPASALDLYENQHFWVNNFYDKRTYDSSHPAKGTIGTRGGWCIGLSIFDSVVDQVGRVEISAVETGNLRYTHVQDVSTPYYWLGQTVSDYLIWVGHAAILPDEFAVRAFDTAGDPINFYDYNGNFVGTSMVIIPSQTAPMPPVCNIKKMKIRNNGDIVMVVEAPYRKWNRDIRIRIYAPGTMEAIYQMSFKPPFQIERPDGTINSDIVKAIVPAEYAGHQGRIEYRIFEDGSGYMVRGVKHFVLP